MRFAQSLMILLTSALVAPSCPAIAAKIELPKIQTDCKTDAQARRPIFAEYFGNSSNKSGSGGRVDFEQENQKNQIKDRISKLIYAKQWDEALAEIQKQSEPIQSELFSRLSYELAESGEINRASRLVITQFPRRSRERARGIGAIAARLLKSNRKPEAIALLKTVPQDSEYLDEATTPVAIAFAIIGQLEGFREIARLFPNSDAQSQIWLGIGELQLELEMSKRFVALIDDPKVRSRTQEKMANRWMSASGKDAVNGWILANEIEDCMIRSRFFVEVADRITRGASNDHIQEKGAILDQVEGLLNAINEDKLGDRKALAEFRLSLVQYNIRVGRKSQATKLLERMTEDQKQFQFYADRAEILLEIANQYRTLKKDSSAIRSLDLAVVAAQTVVKNREESVQKLSNGSSAIARWHWQTLDQIAEKYRSLKQPQKATAIDRILNKPALKKRPLPLFTIPASVPSTNSPSR
ncbi:hypothetical protein [Phormidesmis sp. 146-33]